MRLILPKMLKLRLKVTKKVVKFKVKMQKLIQKAGKIMEILKKTV